jgi:hypothetical protein
MVPAWLQRFTMDPFTIFCLALFLCVAVFSLHMIFCVARRSADDVWESVRLTRLDTGRTSRTTAAQTTPRSSGGLRASNAGFTRLPTILEDPDEVMYEEADESRINSIYGLNTKRPSAGTGEL